MFLVSLSNSSFLLARLNTRSLQSENCFLEEPNVNIISSLEDQFEPGSEYVGYKEGKSSIVIEPPNIDGSTPLLGALLELGDIPHNLLC